MITYKYFLLRKLSQWSPDYVDKYWYRYYSNKDIFRRRFIEAVPRDNYPESDIKFYKRLIESYRKGDFVFFYDCFRFYVEEEE